MEKETEEERTEEADLGNGMGMGGKESGRHREVERAAEREETP